MFGVEPTADGRIAGVDVIAVEQTAGVVAGRIVYWVGPLRWLANYTRYYDNAMVMVWIFKMFKRFK